MEKEKLEQLKNFILKDLLNAPIEGDFLRYEKGSFIVDGQKIPQLETNQLINEARVFQDSWLWKLLVRESNLLGFDLIGVKSKTLDDTFFGKALLYAVDVLNQKIKNIALLEPGKVAKKTKSNGKETDEEKS